jgi:glyoxylase I family protein
VTSGADTSEVRDLLLRYETALANRDGSGIDGALADLIADDFLEIGASGRRWTAPEIRRLLAGEPPQPMTLDDFAITWIGSDVVLATFRIGGTRPTERSSIWVRREGRWTVRFHQGTPSPA